MLDKAKIWLGRKSVRGAIVIGLLVVVALVVLTGGDKEGETEEETLPVVTVTTAQQYAGASTINLIGTVRAFSEAAITAEQSGRVTGVQVALGDRVVAGQVIATLENASERASILQAEGSYEAALAAAAQSGVGISEAQTRVDSAEQAVVSTLQRAYNTVEGVIFNNIDQFYSDPQSIQPGLQISGAGFASSLNDTRRTFRDSLPQQKSRITAVTTDSDLDQAVQETIVYLNQTIAFVDLFIQVFNNQDSFTKYSEQQVIGFGTSFNAARGSLIQLQLDLENALSSLTNAQENLERAELAGATGQNSAADAQVKQALGSLRAAQANLAKTIIRTPIAGTVNSLNVRTGDFISAQSQVAEVANNNALEVVTFVGQGDLADIAVGAEVMIENTITGTITEIAPAVDTNTGKTEVRIASESDALQNGDSVSITKAVSAATTTDVVIPLSAVKFQINDGSVFIVVDGVLTARPVQLGTIRGGSVEVTEGLSATDEFVADARGLVEATAVEVIR